MTTVREPKAAYGELWPNKTDPGDIDQLGDLVVHRLYIKSNILNAYHRSYLHRNHKHHDH